MYRISGAHSIRGPRATAPPATTTGPGLGGVAKLQNGGQETMTVVVQLLEPIKKQAG